MNNVVFANITWPLSHKLSSIKTKDASKKSPQFLEDRETYRQLKKAMVDNSDRITALKFHRNEMNAYWESIQDTQMENWKDKFLIRIDKWVSDFGQDFWKPLRIMLTIHAFLCCGIGIFQVIEYGPIYSGEKQVFIHGITGYFNYLLPTFKSPDYWSPGAQVLAVFMRILNGFFIFHFIKASRRFGKV